MNNDLKDLLIILTTVAAVVCIAIYLSIFVGSRVCRLTGENTHKRVIYKPFVSCFIEINGEMVPLDQWRVIK